MYLIRRTEEEIIARYPNQQMRCPVHLSIGQEAPAVAVAMALRPGDHAYSTHRCHAHYLAMGGDLKKMVAELYGKVTGCAKGMGGSMHLVDESVGFMGTSAIVGSSVSLAVGSALAFQLRGTDQCAVAFMGDSVPETGQFWEAVSFAGLHQLPILFVLENNQYATATHINKRQPYHNSGTSMEERVRPFNVRAYYPRQETVQDTIKSMQWVRDRLPAFLELDTYRYRAHVGMEYDWDQGYRSEAEVKRAMAGDQLDRLREQMDTEATLLIESEITKRVIEAFDAAEAAPYPTEADMQAYGHWEAVQWSNR